MVHVLALSWHVVKHKKRGSAKPKGCLPVTHTSSHAYTICTAGVRGGGMLEDWLSHQSSSPPSLNFIRIVGDPHSQKHLQTRAFKTSTPVACQSWANTEADSH